MPIQPHFDYCSSVWDECNITLCDKLQKLQNSVARVITKSSYDVSANHLLTSLRQDNLAKHRKKLKATLMFKILNSLAPDYLQDMFSIRTTKYNFRNLEMKLNLPKPNTISKKVLATVQPHNGKTYPIIYVRSNHLDLLKKK